MAGHVITSFSTMPPIIPHIRAGRVKALAVTKDKRAAVLPDVPTIAETVPGYAMSTWYGAVAPAKTPREIVVKLNQEMLKALAAAGREGAPCLARRGHRRQQPRGDRGDLQGGSREIHQGREGGEHPGGLSPQRTKDEGGRMSWN